MPTALSPTVWSHRNIHMTLIVVRLCPEGRYWKTPVLTKFIIRKSSVIPFTYRTWATAFPRATYLPQLFL